MTAAAEFSALRLCVLTVSDTRTRENDTSGGAIVEALTTAGHKVTRRKIVPDDLVKLRSAFEEWIGDDPEVDVIIATGGTGITGRDVTPESLAPLVTKAIPGFGELFRQLSFAEIGTSTVQSRATAALCGQTFVFLLLANRRLGPAVAERGATETRRTMYEHVQMLAGLYRRAGQFATVRGALLRHYQRLLAQRSLTPARAAALSDALHQVKQASSEPALIAAAAAADTAVNAP